MCGRTAIGLGRHCLVKGCYYYKNADDGMDNGEEKKYPDWNDPGDCYKPSFNLSPTKYLPCLISSRHLNKDADPDERTLKPMRWGLIPSFYKGSLKDFELSTFNARAEGLVESKVYKSVLATGRRCVIVVEGFYEWKKSVEPGKKKQPYFFYFPQDQVNYETRDWAKNEEQLYKNNGEGFGPRFLTIAGLFDVWRRDDDDHHLLYSCTVITVDAHQSVSWCHNRMPAILDGEPAIQDWLNFVDVQTAQAVKLLKPFGKLCYHPVDPLMGNGRIDGVQCILPYKYSKTSSQPKISSFFPVSPKKTVKERVDDDDHMETGSFPDMTPGTSQSPKKLKK